MRHSISAGILWARTRASTEATEAFEPFQHPRLALERSGAGAAIGARAKEVEEETTGGGRVVEQQHNAAATAERVSTRSERGLRARREAREHARACAAEQQWRARKWWREEEEEECGGRTRGPPPVAYMGGGGGEWDRGAAL